MSKGASVSAYGAYRFSDMRLLLSSQDDFIEPMALVARMQYIIHCASRTSHSVRTILSDLLVLALLGGENAPQYFHLIFNRPVCLVTCVFYAPLFLSSALVHQ